VERAAEMKRHRHQHPPLSFAIQHPSLDCLGDSPLSMDSRTMRLALAGAAGRTWIKLLGFSLSGMDDRLIVSTHIRATSVHW
jgi:hypothetical protein